MRVMGRDECPKCARVRTEHDGDKCRGVMTINEHEPVEWKVVGYVPLEDHQGAVAVLEWLVSMDDPENAERQTVTMTKIIARARAALGGQP